MCVLDLSAWLMVFRITDLKTEFFHAVFFIIEYPSAIFSLLLLKDAVNQKDEKQRSGCDNLSRYSAEVSRCERELSYKSFQEYKFEIWTCQCFPLVYVAFLLIQGRVNVSMRVVNLVL